MKGGVFTVLSPSDPACGQVPLIHEALIQLFFLIITRQHPTGADLLAALEFLVKIVPRLAGKSVLIEYSAAKEIPSI